MHCQFGNFNNENLQKNRRYVYFVRLTEEVIPNFETEEEANAIMPQYVLVGSCMSNLLQSIISFTRDVCLLL